MLKLIVTASGSDGNAYTLLDQNNRSLLIEAGKGTFESVLRTIPDVKLISGLLVSHSHQDHAGDIPKFEKYRIPVFLSDYLVHGEQFEVGPYSVIPVNVNHDDTHCQSFFIRHNEENKTIFFCTDAMSYTRVIGAVGILDAAFIECNHEAHRLDTNTKYPVELRQRISRSHTSLQRCAMAVQQSKCQKFVLLHASKQNIDTEAALEWLRSEFPNRSFDFARPGLVVEV